MRRLPGSAVSASETREQFQTPRAVAQLLRRHANLVQHRQQKVRHRRLLLVDDVAAAVELAGGAADEDERQIVVRVEIRIAQSGAIEEIGRASSWVWVRMW